MGIWSCITALLLVVAVEAIDLVCWGLNDKGQASPPAGLGSIHDMSMGSEHACVLTELGQVICWGSNEFGQTTVPAGLEAIAGVSCGGYHTCVWQSTGGVICWGLDTDGQSTPPGDLGHVVSVAAGWDDNCVVEMGGNVTCWGKDDQGELAVPAGMEPMIGVDLALHHSCAWTAASTFVCWGSNADNQFALPNKLFTQVSVGEKHTCAVQTNRKVKCAGSAVDQQLNVPGFLNNALNVACGTKHNCAGRSGIMCWGDDTFGQSRVPSEIVTGIPLYVRSFHNTNCAFAPSSTTTSTSTTTTSATTTTTSTTTMTTTETHTTSTVTTATLTVTSTSTITTATTTTSTTTSTVSTTTSTITGTTVTASTTTTSSTNTATTSTATTSTATMTTSTVSSTATSTTTASTTTATATTATATTTTTRTGTTSTGTATTRTNTGPSTTLTQTTTTVTTSTISTTTVTATTTVTTTGTSTTTSTTSVSRTTTASTTTTGTTTASTTTASTTTTGTTTTGTTTTTATSTTTSATSTTSSTSTSSRTTTTSITSTATTTSETRTTATVTRSTTTEPSHFFASVQVDVANISHHLVAHARDNHGHWVEDTDVGRMQAVSVDPSQLNPGNPGSAVYVNIGNVALVPVELLRAFAEPTVVVVTELSPDYTQRKVHAEATEDMGEIHGMVDVAVYLARTGERVGEDVVWSGSTEHDIFVKVSEKPEPLGRHPGWCGEGLENLWSTHDRMRKAKEPELDETSELALAPDWTPMEFPDMQALPKVDGDVDTSGVWCTGDHLAIYGFILSPPIVYRCEGAHVFRRDGLPNEDNWASSRRAWFLYTLALFLILAHVYASHSDRKIKAMDRDRMSERLLMTQLMAPGVRSSSKQSNNGHSNLPTRLGNLPRTQQDAKASLHGVPQTSIALLIRCSLETERHPTGHKTYPAEVLRLCFGPRGFLRRFRIFFQAFHPLSVLCGRPLEISCTKHAKLLTDTILFSLALLAFVFSGNGEILHSSCDGENCPLLGFSWAFIYFLVVLFVLAVGLPSRILASLLVPREIERRANQRRDSERRMSDMMGGNDRRSQQGVDYRITHVSSDGRGARMSHMSSDGRGPRMSAMSSDGRGPRMSHLSSDGRGPRMSHISSDGAGHRVSICESDISEKRDKRVRKTRRREQLFWLLGAVWTFLHLLVTMAFLAHSSTRDAWKWETAFVLLLVHIIVIKPLFVALSLTLWTSFVARKWPELVRDPHTNQLPTVRSSKTDSNGSNDELRDLGNDLKGKGLANDDLVLEGIDELQELELDEDTEEAVQKMANRGISVSQLLDFYQRLGADVMPQFDSVVATTEDVVRQAIIPLSRADANMVYGRPLKVRLGILSITEYTGRECDVICKCEVLHRQATKLETWPVPIVGLREVDYGMEAEMLGTEKYDTLEFSLIEADTEQRFCSGRLRAKNLDGDHEVPLINSQNNQVGVIAVQITAVQQAMAPPLARTAIVPSSNQGYLEWCGEDELPKQPPSSSLAAEFCWAGSDTTKEKPAPARFGDTEVLVSQQASRYSVNKEHSLKAPARLPPVWDRSVEGTCYALAYGESTLPHKMVTHCWSGCFTHMVAAVVADALNLETYGQLLPLLGAGDLGKLRSELGAADRLDTTYWIDVFCVNQHKGICADVPNALDSMGVCILPCTCTTQKEASGPNCEIDKMPAVIAHLQTKWSELGAEFTQVVAVDPGYGIFDRAWCLAELHESYLRNMAQTFMLHSYDDLDAQTQLAVVDGIDIQTSKSAHREDKQQILGKIDDPDTFNEHVKSVVNFRMRNPSAPPTTRVSMVNVLIDNLLQ